MVHTTFLSRGISALGVRRGRYQEPVKIPSYDFAPPPRQIKRLANSDAFWDMYTSAALLCDSGEHGQNHLYKAIDKQTGHEVIIKTRDRRFAPGGESVWRAVLNRMLNMEENCHVLGLYDIFDDAESYYIVMERCSGGELYDFLQAETDVPETECKRIMREILEAVDHMHSKGIIHRDIKPENIMFHDTRGDLRTPATSRNRKAIKLIDFDTCLQFTPTTPRAQSIVGTVGYIAPEALQGEYSPASDLWSVGVILYILMTGIMPFDPEVFEDSSCDLTCGSDQVNRLYERLKDTHIDFECDPWPMFPQARNLCEQLLAFAPGDRTPSARLALAHPWLIS